MSAWTVIKLERSLGQYACAWDELSHAHFGAHPMLASGVIDGLLAQYGTGSEYLCLLEQNAEVRAMCVLRKLSGAQWSSFLPSQAQLGATLIADDQTLPALLRSLPGLALQLDLLCNDPDVGGVLAREGRPQHRLPYALTIRIRLDGSFAGYWAARPAPLQAQIAALHNDGQQRRLAAVSAPDQIIAAYERMVQLDALSGKDSALGAAPQQDRFYRQLLARAALDGKAVIHELWIDQQLAASRLVLREARIHVMLQSCTDPRFAQQAPHDLLLYAAIEHAFASTPHGGAMEFATDADVKRFDWASEQRWIEHKSVHRWPLTDDLQVLLRAWRGSASDPTLAVQAYPRLDAMPDAAMQLLDRAEDRNIGLGSSWYANLVATVYPTDPGVRFYVLTRGAQVVAVLPLRASGAQLGALANFYTTLYEPVLAPDLKGSELAPLIACLRRDFPKAATLTFTPMDPHSHAYQTLKAALRHTGWRPFEFFAFGNWYQPIVGDWPAYLGTRNGTLRSTIKRMTKKFAGDGGTLQIVTGVDDMAVAIAAYQEVYDASWKKAEPFPDFMPGLLRTYAEKGFLRLGLAWLDGKAIAAQLWIVSHGRAEIYKVAYHESYKAYSPGTLVTAMLMEHVIEVDQVKEVDYLIGDDPYKKTWMSHRRERWGIVAYNPRLAGGLLGLARESLGRVSKTLRARLPARAKSGKD